MLADHPLHYAPQPKEESSIPGACEKLNVIEIKRLVCLQVWGDSNLLLLSYLPCYKQ